MQMMADRASTSFRQCLVAIGLTMAVCVPQAALSRGSLSSDPRLLAWASSAFRVPDGPVLQPTHTAVDDYFGPAPYSRRTSERFALAANGQYLDTAGKGSTWAYDAVHGIAAYSEIGDLHGDSIMLMSPPPRHFRNESYRTSYPLMAYGSA